jgi:four helix bundle protein
MAGRDIAERTFRFAVRIVKLVHAMPRSVAGGVIGRQVMRAGTSVGANVEEAQAASSAKEFSRRMEIAQSEAREVLYWLRLISECELAPKKRLAELLQEADELVRIITTIAKRSRGRWCVLRLFFRIPHSPFRIEERTEG